MFCLMLFLALYFEGLFDAVFDLMQCTIFDIKKNKWPYPV